MRTAPGGSVAARPRRRERAGSDPPDRAAGPDWRLSKRANRRPCSASTAHELQLAVRCCSAMDHKLSPGCTVQERTDASCAAIEAKRTELPSRRGRLAGIRAGGAASSRRSALEARRTGEAGGDACRVAGRSTLFGVTESAGDGCGLAGRSALCGPTDSGGSGRIVVGAMAGRGVLPSAREPVPEGGAWPG